MGQILPHIYIAGFHPCGVVREALNDRFRIGSTAKAFHPVFTLIKRAGLSVKDMQMVFGFATPQAIYKWIHGTAMPTIDNLVILAAMVDVTMDEIVVVDVIAQKWG